MTHENWAATPAFGAASVSERAGTMSVCDDARSLTVAAQIASIFGAVQEILPIHKAQLFSYMKLLDAPTGLLINFREQTLRDGIRRMILPGATGGESTH